METVVYTSMLLAISLNSVHGQPAVSMGLLPSKAVEGSRLTLTCNTGEPKNSYWSTWYQGNELMLKVGVQQGNGCQTQEKNKVVEELGEIETTCNGNIGSFRLIFKNVSTKLNNTVWRCDIDGQESRNVTVEILPKPTVTLQLAPAVVELGSELKMTCEYSQKASSITWNKDGKGVIRIRHTTENNCMEEMKDTELQDAIVTCPNDRQFVLTIPKVKQEFNGTFWDCFVNIYPSPTRTIVVSGRRDKMPENSTETSRTDLREGSEATTPSFLVPVVVSVGCGLMLVVIIIIILVCRKRRQHSYIDNESSNRTKEEIEENNGRHLEHKQSLVIQENYLYDSSSPEECPAHDIYTSVKET